MYVYMHTCIYIGIMICNDDEDVWPIKLVQFKFLHASSLIVLGPPHIADCQLASVSYTSASIDWLPLKADGKIAPIDRYTIEVVHGTKTIQRVEKTGTITHLVLPDVLQPDTLYTSTLFGSNSAGNGPPCHVSFSTNEGLLLSSIC